MWFMLRLENVASSGRPPSQWCRCQLPWSETATDIYIELELPMVPIRKVGDIFIWLVIVNMTRLAAQQLDMAHLQFLIVQLPYKANVF